METPTIVAPLLPEAEEIRHQRQPSAAAFTTVMADAVVTAAAQQQAATLPAAAVAVVAIAQALQQVACAQEEQDEIATIAVLQKFRVQLYDSNVDETLKQLDRLEHALVDLPFNNNNSNNNNFWEQQQPRAPGFWTQNDNNNNSGGFQWKLAPGTPYETPNVVYSAAAADHHQNRTNNLSIVPNAKILARCCQLIRQMFTERRDYLLKLQQSQDAATACSCIAQWDHVKGANVLDNLVIQALEQLMVQEASECLEAMNSTSSIHANMTETHTARYQAHLCPPPSSIASIAIPQTPVLVLRHRDVYLQTLVQLALAAEHTIQLSTCYLHAMDPAVRYIFLNLLPHCMETRGVTVQVLVDLMVIESMVVKSAFQVAIADDVDDSKMEKTINSTAATGGVTSTSFLEHLPQGAPYFTAAQEKPESALDFLRQLTEMAAASTAITRSSDKKGGRFQIEFWCARDAQHRYRIKNHAKCVVFDRQAAIIGGSNVCPTMGAAKHELDLLVAGPAAEQVGASFEALWNAVAAMTTSTSSSPPEEIKTETMSSSVVAALGELSFADACPVTIIRSQPSSQGEDVILRVMLGTIHAAQSSIIMCFGHSNYPAVLVEALAVASERGVRVQILVNSLYSCDLRGGQRDLFLSLRALLRRAPLVEVYATTMKKQQQAAGEQQRPNFVHAKYVSVDGHWNAVGSWNVWMRGSFYEIEHEALVESAVIAQVLEEKFEFDKASTAVRLETPDQCEPGKGFCPTGCAVCRGFGPFFAA